MKSSPRFRCPILWGESARPPGGEPVDDALITVASTCFRAAPRADGAFYRLGLSVGNHTFETEGPSRGCTVDLVTKFPNFPPLTQRRPE